MQQTTFTKTSFEQLGIAICESILDYFQKGVLSRIITTKY